MNRIIAKGKIVNNGEIEIRFTGKNMTSVGGIKLFHKFALKLGVEKVLKQRINLPRKEGRYKTGRVPISLLYALVLALIRLSGTACLQADRFLAEFLGVPYLRDSFHYDTSVCLFYLTLVTIFPSYLTCGYYGDLTI